MGLGSGQAISLDPILAVLIGNVYPEISNRHTRHAYTEGIGEDH